MDRGSIRAVRTPATARFLPAVERADWERALKILDENWVEIWFAIDPTDLRSLVGAAPPDLLCSLDGASYVARATGHGAVDDLLEPHAVPGRDATPGELIRYIADLRLRGRPVEALAQVRRSQELVRAQRGGLLDGSGGTVAMWLVQAAITALLAGDASTARGFFLTACDAHRPDRFPFVVREATAKLALTHALSGDVREAAHLNDRARSLPRTESWVEAMVDDTIWLTDYICAVDTLDPSAEELRQARPSPLAHRELWPIALQAHVRHLVLTGRRRRAEELCDTVAAAVPPSAGSEGLLATALPDARTLIKLHGVHPSDLDGNAAHTDVSVLAHAVHLFASGQYRAVMQVELRARRDERCRRALALLRAQATIADGRPAEGRHLLLQTVHEVLERRTYGTLRYLTRETLESIADTDDGARAIALVESAALPSVEVRAVLAAPLSEAEIDVLRLLRDGLTREEMATRLFLSVNTVKTQLRSAYRKLGVNRRPEALEKLALLEL
ncbi:helix-turn-helix transcriptional regulator [Georgenia sp. 311]|uniref:response regulator transcription factor n=1 Tax=Georgenia sp. 311 TaxID=2585134 RepID=UPI0011123595|nr:helix-turn-helix transcriptional regulator [Georgenia sp. 311]TNC18421.1 helix-turn-helix transcriptional regulator [Georgenia sp. 311]